MPENDCELSNLNIKPGFKIMMMGSLEEDIADASTPPEDLPEVFDDFDIEDEEEVAIESKEVYLAKVDKRIREYEVNIAVERQADEPIYQFYCNLDPKFDGMED